jgi:prepilin-type N-terminal cleavage/methylation domain-containing protein
MTRLNMPSKNRGVTLIELLIALVISSILIAALYRTFIGQQKTYIVQDQVVDMQQNVRVAINKMMREIRMAGFGNVSNVLPLDAHDGPFNNVINSADNVNHVGQNDDQITIIGAFELITTLATDVSGNSNRIEVNGYASKFKPDTGPGEYEKYICIGGLESLKVTSIADKKITLSSNLKNSYAAGAPVYKIHAITYHLGWDTTDPTKPVLRREDNTTQGGAQPLADNIENVQFEYFDDANPPNQLALPIADPGIIRMIRVTVTAKTNMADPAYKGGDGFRRRTIASNIQVRNMGIFP